MSVLSGAGNVWNRCSLRCAKIQHPFACAKQCGKPKISNDWSTYEGHITTCFPFSEFTVISLAH